VSIMEQVRIYERKVQKEFVEVIVSHIIRDLHHKDEVRFSDYLRGTKRTRKPVENAFKQLVDNKTVTSIRRGIYGRGKEWDKNITQT
jgi:hypothetical protein